MPNLIYIDFNITRFSISRSDRSREPVTTDNQNFVYARFTFSSDWDGLTKTAIFSREDMEPASLEIYNNECHIPNEFMAIPGIITVSVFGGDRRTVSTATVEVIQGGFREAQPPAITEPSSMYVQTPDSSVPYIGYDGAFWFDAEGERKRIAGGDIKPANLISDDMENALVLGTDDKLYVPRGAMPYVLYLARRNGNAVFTSEKPTVDQVVIDRIWRPAIWGQWHNIATMRLDESIVRTMADVVIGNIFTAKLWLSSDVSVQNVQLQLTVTDLTDNTDIANAFTEVNLNNVNTNLIPATFINKFQVTRQTAISQIQISLSAMHTASGTQFGVVSNPTDRLSFATIMASDSTSDIISSLMDRIALLEMRMGG